MHFPERKLALDVKFLISSSSVLTLGKLFFEVHFELLDTYV